MGLGLAETSLQMQPVVLRGPRGLPALADGTAAANKAAADSVRKMLHPGINTWALVALVGLTAIIYNLRVRRG